jgi:divalent metal cation (Fe/Co/Zn/Cd) transporter
MLANVLSTQIIDAALVGNLLVAFIRASAAVWTGSSAMFSEAIHSFVDTGDQLLLLCVMRRAKRQADPDHSIGYGRKLYFCGFLVALPAVALGAVVSMYNSVLHMKNPEPIHDPLVNEIVLGSALVWEGAWWWVFAADSVLTVQLAPDQILAALGLEFPAELRVCEVEAAVMEIERQVRAAHPEVLTLFIKLQTAAAFTQTVRERFDGKPAELSLVFNP